MRLFSFRHCEEAEGRRSNLSLDCFGALRRLAMTVVVFVCLDIAVLAYAEPVVKTEEHIARTKDGWNLSIKRYYTNTNAKSKGKAAVILCHGFNINNTLWDLDKRSSTAGYLAKNGYDVWAPDLRGSGQSSKPFLSNLKDILKFEFTKLHRSLIRAPMNIPKINWNLDDHIHQDAPAIIRLVKKNSGFEKVYWIGHSMGGLVMFGYLETENQDNIAGFIPMASMVIIPEPLDPTLEAITKQNPLTTVSLLVNTSAASHLRNVTFSTIKHPLERLLMNKENMHSDVVFRYFRITIDDTSVGIVSQFSRSLNAGEMLSRDGSYSYTENLHKVRVPILFMLGSRDGFSSEKSFRAAYEAVSSKDKKIVIFSKENGCSADYGHCDLVLGKNSEDEVYPVILKWLEERTK